MKWIRQFSVIIVFLAIAGMVTAQEEKGEKEEKTILESLHRHTFDIGAEMYNFNYEEPGVMKDKGVFNGASFGYTFRGWVPKSSDESAVYLKKKRMTRLEGRFAFGKVDYDGGIIDFDTGEVTPIIINNIDNFAVEGRLLFGADWLRKNILHTLYLGLGYRYLNDDPSDQPSFYERQSNYYYLPIGYEIDTNLNTGLSLGGRAEFDYLLWGIQESHLSDIDPLNNDVENHQKNGYGYRFSLRLQYKLKNMILSAEPFIRYWNVDDSDIIFDSFEPENNTTEYGIQLALKF